MASHEPVISDRTNLLVFGGLLLLTLATFGAAYLDLGPWNAVIAYLIAVGKAGLIILFFMHARYSSWLTWVIIGAGVFWLGILYVLTFSDYLTRTWYRTMGF